MNEDSEGEGSTLRDEDMEGMNGNPGVSYKDKPLNVENLEEVDEEMAEDADDEDLNLTMKHNTGGRPAPHAIDVASMGFSSQKEKMGDRVTGVRNDTENKTFKGSLMGISIGSDTSWNSNYHQKRRSLQALGAMAFANSFSIILIEIQDTISSPPAEHKTMRICGALELPENLMLKEQIEALIKEKNSSKNAFRIQHERFADYEVKEPRVAAFEAIGVSMPGAD
ncbi:Amino acid permease 2 [Spatholobus suberectus]|nr:Amino acid permease 2 [Spatholobus suberectus]